MRVLIWVIQARAFAGQPLHGIRRFNKKKKKKKKERPSTRDFDTYRISNASLCISCVRDTAAKSGFLATISHKVKFSKDIVLKSEGIISHKHFLMLFLQQHFKSLHTFAVVLFSMNCSQSCWSLHFLLTNTDAHSDSGHQSFSHL